MPITLIRSIISAFILYIQRSKRVKDCVKVWVDKGFKQLKSKPLCPRSRDASEGGRFQKCMSLCVKPKTMLIFRYGDFAFSKFYGAHVQPVDYAVCGP